MPRRRALPTRPVHYAALIAGAYLLGATAWILGSGHVAALLTDSAEALARLEQLKGLAFVGVTGLLLFGFSLVLFRRSERDDLRAHEARDALVVAERRALAGVLASAVTHDINNLLTALMGLNELLLADPRLQERSRVRAEEMRRAIDRLAALVARMREASGQATARQPKPLALGALAGDVVELLRSHPRVRRCRVELVRTADPCLVGEASHIHTALANLVLNAAEATGGTGAIEVRVSQRDAETAVLEVHDDGPGVPQEVRRHLFEAFYTTKTEGTGLGLLSVQACVAAHGGSVDVGDSPLGGACFRMVLAGVRSAPEAAKATEPADA